jgi:hypothetical protein
MSATDPTTPEPRHVAIRLPRPLWIGVAAAVVIVVAVGLRIGVPIYRKRVAIREIERIGWIVVNRPPTLPAWIRSWIGDEWQKVLDEVEYVNVPETRFTDAGMQHLKHLGPLEWEGFDGMPLTDTGLFHLREITSLERLFISETRITDAGLVHLRELKNLKTLSLDRTRVTDAGLAHISALKNLESLSLNETQITDAGLVHLTLLTKLKNLTLLKTTGVTDAGVSELKRVLPNLKVSRLHRRKYAAE